MRVDLERLLRDSTFTTIAFAIALGWALLQLAQGFSYLVTEAVQETPGGVTGVPNSGLTVAVGSHVFDFQPLVGGLVQFGVVLLVVLLLRRWVGERPRSRNR
jgi:hypothetical protein